MRDYCYRLLFEAGPDGMLLVDTGETIVDANPAACRLLGRGRKELVDSGLEDIFDPAYPWLKAARDGRRAGIFRGGVRLVRADGASFPAEVSLVEGEDGQMGVVFRGVTGRERAEDASLSREACFEALVENALDLITVCDPDNTIRYISPSAKRILGYEPEELVGVYVPDLIHPDDLELSVREAHEFLANPEHKLAPVRYRRKDGSYAYLESVFKNMLDKPNVRGIVGNSRDVTERVKTEQEIRGLNEDLERQVEERTAQLRAAMEEADDSAETLRLSVEWFRSLVPHAAEVITLLDEDGIIRYQSPSIERVLGYSANQLVGDYVLGYVHPGDLGQLSEALGETLAEPDARAVAEFRFRHEDGSWRHLEAAVTNLFSEPHVGGIVMNSCDVTERREAELRYRTLVEQIPAVTYVQELGRNSLTYVSHQLFELMGYSPEEYLADPGLRAKTIHPEDREWVFAEDARTKETGELYQVEHRRVHRDGRVIWTRDEAILIRDSGGRPLFWQGLLTDVTERKRTEETLRESEERFRSTFEQAAVGVAHLSPGGHCLEVNQRLCDILGYDREEFLKKTFQDITHPDDREADRSYVRRLLAGEIRWYSIEKRYFRKDGSVIWTNLTVSLVRDPSGEPDYFVTVVEDVSERKRVGEALEQSEQLYRSVVEQAAENIFLVDAESKRILEADAVLAETLGYAEEELERMTLYDIVAHDRKSTDRNVRRVLEEGQIFLGERAYRRRDGSLAYVEVSGGAIRLGDRDVVCIVAHEITERKQADEDLRRSLDVLLALRQAGHILGSTLEPEEIGVRLMEIMRRVSGLTTAVIKMEDERRRLHVWRAIGLEHLRPRARYAPEVEAARRAALETGERRRFRLRRPGDDEHPVGLCLPLRVRNRIIGILEVYGPETLAEEDTVAILDSLASQAARALENAVLYQELVEREEQLENLVGKLFAAQEEERRHVAYEIHDGLAQVATTAYQHLQAFARRYPPSSERSREDLDRILKRVRQTVEEARRIIANLRPTALDDFGLAAAIQMQIEDLRNDGWRADFEEELGKERLPIAMETALFRVAQEALANARKHARTERVRVELRRREDRVHLEIRDWGRGFDPASLGDEDGPGERVGLAGMRERIGVLGGEIEIRSRPGAGTAIIAAVPLPEAAEDGNQRHSESDG